MSNSISENLTEISDPDHLTPNPLVSVLIITYNHAEYIAEAIAGVVAQQCEFEYELIIGEDASTDDTLRIALEHQKLYPRRIRIIHADRNVGVVENAKRVFARARGRFVAFCEGDDYWCSRSKLARQIALISTDSDIGIVHSDWVRSRSTDTGWVVDWKQSVHSRVPMSLLHGNLFKTFYYPKILRTCTVLVRKDADDDMRCSQLWQTRYAFGDIVRAAYMTSRWKVAWLPEVTAVYRESPNSILRSGLRARLEFLRNSLKFDSEARQYFADRSDYPAGYRWEVAIGLLLWAISGGQFRVAVFALDDLRKHFNIWTFLRAGWSSLRMRCPMLNRRSMLLPADIRRFS